MIDRLPLPALIMLANMLVLARVTARLPGWAWTYATAGRRGIRRYSLGAELRLLASQARWERTEDPAWLRRVRAWYTQHPDAPPSLGRSYALMLALLAIPLSFVNPRAGRTNNLILAVLVYLIYSNAVSVCQSWIGQGRMRFDVGLLAPHVVMLGVLAILFYRRISVFARWRRR